MKKLKWYRVQGGYETWPQDFRIEKTRGGWRVYYNRPVKGMQVDGRGMFQWVPLYKHPFASAKEAKKVCEG